MVYCHLYLVMATVPRQLFGPYILLSKSGLALHHIYPYGIEDKGIFATYPHCNVIYRCSTTAKAIPKDKAVKRFSVRNMVDASALRDIKDASAYDNYSLPKLYIKQYYCIEAAVHQRVVRFRSVADRRNREPPVRVKPAGR